MNAKILRLNKAGTPVSWLTREETATLLVKDQVIWSLGDTVFEMHGGYNRCGVQSVLQLPSIIACEGKVHTNNFEPPLENRFLFRRDKNLCLYCGGIFPLSDLSRDHVHPLSKGGADRWTNVVSSCRRCNNRKADRLPEEANMELLAIPFVPNQYEFLYLCNHNVLADQMEFLSARFSHHIKIN
ncbi:MAG: HNH endonuclease [Gammaproteobacteria bacterium]|nr:HNH endonuclease [Gammaproteobacteria bacterium]MBT3860150.1 HNH endonuclease [Gammaproteobacteria bacterium]MBT3987442.1 HNH endonuclease [Gammaproteobacteria bacterium]MBT4257235.1 HNH endonuclease [Gammaproteobacteria bacterium]MBT4581820.1 HNH endonuclease [Gammaproteobacteria bacterium]